MFWDSQGLYPVLPCSGGKCCTTLHTWEVSAVSDRPVAGGVEPVVVAGRQVDDTVEQLITYRGEGFIQY